MGLDEMFGGELTDEQVRVLRRPLHRSRVLTKDGQSHLAAWDVRAHLTRIFGYGQWSADLLEMHQLYETEIPNAEAPMDKPPRWRAAYRATVRLTIHATGATYTESAVGDTIGTMPDSKRAEAHDMAVKTAESQALKRCAVNLGTQFGLSLYNHGSLDDVIRVVVGHDELDPEDTTNEASYTEPVLDVEAAGDYS